MSSLKAVGGKGDKGKGGAGMKKTVSLSELQPHIEPPKPVAKAAAQLPRPAAGLQLLKRSFSMGKISGRPAPGGKAQAPLGPLAPIERTILAAVGKREWIKIDAQVPHFIQQTFVLLLIMIRHRWHIMMTGCVTFTSKHCLCMIA